MSRLALNVRADVLMSLRTVLLPWETLPSVIEDLAYCEAQARFQDTVGFPAMDCQMSSDLAALAVDVSAGPLRLLTGSVHPGENLDGLVTALMIGEIRYRRTHLVPHVESADEAVMPADLLELEHLLTENAAVTHQKETRMFTIPMTVRKDALTAFDNSLADCEDRNEVLGLLIGLEAECRDEGYVSCDGTRDLSGFAMTTIDVELDVDTCEAMMGGLRPAEDQGAFITALMIDALRGRRSGPARADELVAVA